MVHHNEVKDIKKKQRINERIRAREVRLIGEEGEQLGIFPVREALEIARLADAAVLSGGTTSIGDYYRVVVAELGQEAQQANVMANNQDLLVKHLEGRQEEISGVSLDEETVYMLQYQRTYQAAARMMTTVDEMLEKVINEMGLVGR